MCFSQRKINLESELHVWLVIMISCSINMSIMVCLMGVKRGFIRDFRRILVKVGLNRGSLFQYPIQIKVLDQKDVLSAYYLRKTMVLCNILYLSCAGDGSTNSVKLILCTIKTSYKCVPQLPNLLFVIWVRMSLVYNI